MKIRLGDYMKNFIWWKGDENLVWRKSIRESDSGGKIKEVWATGANFVLVNPPNNKSHVRGLRQKTVINKVVFFTFLCHSHFRFCLRQYKISKGYILVCMI